VRFWDSSAIIPLLILEESSRRLQSLAAQDFAMLVWWGSVVELFPRWRAVNAMGRSTIA